MKQETKSKHQYSTITLIILVFIFIGGVVISLDSGDIDLICNQDNEMLIRINGEWICTTDLYLREDFRFPVESIRQGAATEQPIFTTFVGDTIALAFSPTQMQEGFVNIQMPHGRLDNSTLKPHFHWSASNTNTGNVVWCLEYTCANINDVFPPVSFDCVLDAGSGTANTHQMTNMINITNTLEASSMCMIRLFRNATDTRDTYNANAHLLEFDIHYTAQAIGEVFI